MKRTLSLVLLLIAFAILLTGASFLTSHPSSVSRIFPQTTTQPAQVSCSSVCTGLMGYWPFDDGSGTTALDASGSGNNGTLTPSSNPPAWTTGKIGSGALSFAGSGQYVLIGNKYDAPATFTLSAWIEPSSLASSESFLGKLVAGKGYRLDIIKSAGNYHVVLEMNNSSFTGLTSLQTGTWYLVTATYDGTTATVYVNGSVDASGASGVPGSNTSNFQIGNGNEPSSYSGILDDIRIYNRALSSSEVSSLYSQAGSSGSTPSTPTPTPPVISSITSSSITTTGATITWTTDQSSDSEVNYGLTTAYGNSTPLNPTLTTSHSSILSNLTPNTLYHYQVLSRNSSGTLATSADQTFTTAQTQQTTTTTVPTGTYTPTATGPVIAAASCAESDVEAAINQATTNDVIQIPAGTCTWTSTLNLTIPVTLEGAGEDVTTIVDNVPKNQQTGQDRISPQVFIITANPGGLTRLTNFTLDGGTGIDDPYNSGMVKILGTSQTWRVDHMHVITTRTSAFMVYASSGVLDHNIFDLAPASYYAVYGFNGSYGSDGATDPYGDSSWAEPADFGTARAFFVEDNLFRTSGAHTTGVDGWSGEHITVRYNTFQNVNVADHGTESPGLNRGARALEIYDNTFSNTGTQWPLAMTFRSGSVLVFDNTITGNYTTIAGAYEYRDFDPYNIWDQCDGSGPYDDNAVDSSGNPIVYDSGTSIANSTVVQDVVVLTVSGKNWTPNQWLGYSVNNTTTGLSTTVQSNTANTITMLSDPEADPVSGRAPLSWSIGDKFTITRALFCIDQMGRGAGTLWSRNSDDMPDPPSVGWAQEVSEPSYFWNNTLNGVVTGMVSGSTHILSGRDFINGYSMPGYTPYTYPHPLVQEEDGTVPTQVSTNPTGAPPVYTPPATSGTGSTPTQTTTGTPATPATVTTQTPTIPQTPMTPTKEPGVSTLSALPTGLTSAEIQSILNLLISFNADQSVINQVSVSLGGGTTTTETPTTAFTRTLSLGMTGTDVKELQIFLNTHGFTVSSSGNGSPNHETTYYGLATAHAVSLFQEANASLILTPNHLTTGTGTFGPATREVVNQLI